jgi:hypothetical protein
MNSWEFMVELLKAWMLDAKHLMLPPPKIMQLHILYTIHIHIIDCIRYIRLICKDPAWSDRIFINLSFSSVFIFEAQDMSHKGVVVSVCCGTLLFATHSANSTKKKRQTVLIPWERTNAMTSCPKLSFCTSQFNFLHKKCFAPRHEHPLHCSTNHSVFTNRRLDPAES